jgi:glucose-6-phosphate isomerase
MSVPVAGPIMYVDVGGALAEAATPGIPRASLERLDRRVERAHDRVETGIEDREHGYAALALPEDTDPGAIRSAVDRLAPHETVLVVGIGGSALGAATLGTLADGDLLALDNVDPAHVGGVLADLDLERTATVAVSRSGTTTETIANFLAVRAAYREAGVDWTERTLVVTGEEGPLRALADREELPALSVPPGVPGRFGVLSAVGLAPAAAAGVDVEAVLAGASEASGALAGSLFDAPAYAYGATAYALATRGVTVDAMMPYAESLETFAEWFAQLWAESLGKDGLGQVPARALGATDQHSQLQLYRDGPRETVVTLVRPRERPTHDLPETGLAGTEYLGGRDLGTVIDAEFEATAASLVAADRPHVRVEVPAVDARSLGELLYGMEAACVLAGELFGVDAFDQPAVEWGKRAARGLLGESTPESRAVGDRPTLGVGDDSDGV